MKKYIAAAFALFLAAATSFAQLPTSGDWNGTSADGKSRRVNTQTVNLIGDIDLNCTIIVGNGKTLTINSNGASRAIYNKVAASDRSGGMFQIEAGGKLIINGASGARITLGGGGNFDAPSYNTTLMPDGIIDNANALVKKGSTIEMGAPAILNQGIVELNYVTIQNVCNTKTLPGDGGNIATSGGAIVHGNSATSTTMDHCTVNQILANSGAGVYVGGDSDGDVTISDSEFKNCINYTTATGLHGGVIRGWGNSKANITLNRVKIHHCYSNVDAGAIYFPSNGTNSTTHQQAVLTLNGCEFYNNCAYNRSGALDICANLELKTALTKVYHNYVKRRPVSGDPAHIGIGGGISFRAYDSGSNPPNPVNVIYNATNLLEVYGNKSHRGGGIAFYASDVVTLLENSTFTLNVNGARIHDNEADGYGGGIWMRNDDGGLKGYEFNLNLNSGEVYSNKAPYGGGLYVNNWNVGSSTTGTIKIYKNTATTSGGAVYLQNTTYVMNSGTIGGSDNGNTAANHAGGIYLANGSSFTFNGGEVSYNTAGGNGGGIGVFNSSMAFSNGSVMHNHADGFGGGLYCANAGTTVTFTGNIKDNTAMTGGGIAMDSGASFTMKGGVISGNKLIDTASGAPTTTYNANNSGFGGGICLFNTAASGTTSLTVDVSEGTAFGLYGNTATMGGNDITSSGVRTSVKLPNVKSMELADFKYAEAVPNWYEDYNAGDANYSYGTNLDAATNARYADQLTANTYLKHLVSFEGNSHTYTNYLNLTLGYELLRIVISAKGLVAGESALFHLTYAEGTANERSWPVLLTGNGSTAVSKTIRNLNYGQYKAEPARAWQWNYTVDDPPSGYYNEPVDAGPEKKFEFTLTRNALDVKTDEERVVNKIEKTP